MNAEQILAVPLTTPERVFKRIGELKAEYHALMKLWHPDRNKDPKAAAVASHLAALYEAAEERAKSGLWCPPGLVRIRNREGKTYEISYRAKHAFELGEMLIGSRLLTFLIRNEHEDLMLNGLRCFGNLRYPTAQFRDSLEKHLPRADRTIHGETHYAVCMRKDEDEVAIADLISYLGGKIEAKHAAWIMSSLYNLLSYLSIDANLMTVNGLTTHTVFVNTLRHSASLYGGWWYGAKVGKPIKSLPPETHHLAPRSLLISKKASHALDLESIKAIGRACLGDASGGTLRLRDDVPKAMANFLRLPAGTKPVAEYENWHKVLTDSFGPRRFHKLEITGKDVYKETS